jgi:glutaredoxin 3
MGKITVFSLDGCPTCNKTRQLLETKGAVITEVSLTTTPDWAPLLFVLANGDKSLPQVFFNSHHVGGSVEVEEMEREGVLGDKVKACLEGGSEDFLPPLRSPKPEEYVQIIPAELRNKWQQYMEALDSPLGGTADRPISSILVTLETPHSIVVLCTAGPAKEAFAVGAAVAKGAEGSQKKAYCQVALEMKMSLFVTDPTTVPGLEQNELMVSFGYSYYAGAPWIVGHHSGTVVAMEKEAGILKPDHMAVLEATRDKIVADFTHYKDTHKQ